MADRPARNLRRPAFTLVEMLVVLIIALMLAAIAVAFIPRVTEQQKVTRAADMLQGWLLIAKQRALRDGLPTGIRLQLGTTYPNAAAPNPAWVSELQYIQQPEDFSVRPGVTPAVEPTYIRVRQLQVVDATATLEAPPSPPSPAAPGPPIGSGPGDFTGGRGLDPSAPLALQQALWPVQPGDYLQIGSGPVHRITAVTPNLDPASRWYVPGSTRNECDTLTLESSAGSVSFTKGYRIIRAPRVLTGETALQLPQDVIIDATTNGTYGSALPSNPLAVANLAAGGVTDIVFSPSGSVISAGSGNDKIHLWLRDATQDATVPGLVFQGDQVLMTIYVRTGSISAHPVDTTPGTGTPPRYANPYSFTQDGRSSGL